MIEDKDVCISDPDELIRQYEPLLFKIMKRYRKILQQYPDIDEDDLLQAGRLTIYKCQSKYDPEKSSFVSYIFDRCRSAMRHVLRYRQDGKLPTAPISLDSPLTGEDDGRSIADVTPDPGPGPEESLEDADEREQVAKSVRDAVDRLANERQRITIRRVWLDEIPREQVAAEIGTTIECLYQADREGRDKLRRDKDLAEFAMRMPRTHVTVSSFNTTFTSETERGAIWLTEYREKIKAMQKGEVNQHD